MSSQVKWWISNCHQSLLHWLDCGPRSLMPLASTLERSFASSLWCLKNIQNLLTCLYAMLNLQWWFFVLRTKNLTSFYNNSCSVTFQFSWIQFFFFFELLDPEICYNTESHKNLNTYTYNTTWFFHIVEGSKQPIIGVQ